MPLSSTILMKMRPRTSTQGSLLVGGAATQGETMDQRELVVVMCLVPVGVLSEGVCVQR